MMSWLKKFLAYFITFWAFFLFGLALLVCYPILMPLKTKDKYIRLLFYFISKMIFVSIKLISKSFVVEIKQEIKQGAGLIVSNHASILDIICFANFGLKDIVFFAKGWPLKIPLLKSYIKHGGSIIVKNDTTFEEIAAQAKKAFSKGLKLVVYPEGTRSKNEQVQRFHSGAFELAKKFNVPITVFALKGLGYTFAKNSFVAKPANIRLVLVKSFFVQNDKRALNIAKEVKAMIIQELKENKR